MLVIVSVIVIFRAFPAAIIAFASAVKALTATPVAVPAKFDTLRIICTVPLRREAVYVDVNCVAVPLLGVKSPAVQVPMFAVVAHPHW